MGLFGRRTQRRGAKVRIASARELRAEASTDWGRVHRHRWHLRLEIEFYEGDLAEVERKFWVPAECNPQALAASGHRLNALIIGADLDEIEINWDEVDRAVSKDDLATLFHKRGPPQERLELLERLNASGVFTPHQYENGKRELLLELEQERLASGPG